jgi:cytochrome c oxidase subunit II
MRHVKRMIFLILLFWITGCSPTANFLVPASPVASREAELFRILLWMSAAVFLIVEGLLIYNIVHRARSHGIEDGGEETPQNYRQYTIEAIYTGIPVILVVVIFVLMNNTMRAIAAPAPQSSDIKVHVIGHRWWWEFDYPDLKITTATELHIPVNQTVQVELTSLNVIHSFYVPQLSGKTDVIPGMTNHTWLRGDTIGQYHGQCAEFCGANHANMRMTVYVDSQADFDAWVANQQKPPTAPKTAEQKVGQDIVTNGVCSGCHDLGDSGPGNATGPNLTHLMSRKTFAGGMFDLTSGNLLRWLQDTQVMKPGNEMDHQFTNQQIEALISYLTTLK